MRYYGIKDGSITMRLMLGFLGLLESWIYVDILSGVKFLLLARC